MRTCMLWFCLLFPESVKDLGRGEGLYYKFKGPSLTDSTRAGSLVGNE